MFKTAVFTRYTTYMVGILTTAINLLMITYYLDVNEFAVWGIASSIVYIFSQLGQLTYVQYIDKYFPNMSFEETKIKIFQFLKTIILFSPIWLSFLFLLDGLGYFDKFLIENIYILFLLLVTLIVLESGIEITSKYMLALQKTQSYDLNEFLVLKLLRSLLFFGFLYNGFSIYHLFFVSILLRSSFLLSILSKNEKNIRSLVVNIISASVFKNNFENLKYTSVAFAIKTLQITFLNVIFLIYSNFSESTEIATYSLGILLINNLRPVISSFSSLLTPKISKRANIGNKSSSFLQLTSFLNTFLSSLFICGSLLLFLFEEYINDYFIDYEGNVIFTIFLSIIAATIMSIYHPVLLMVKFSEKERTLLKRISTSYVFCLLLFYISQLIELNNLILFYILFELLNLIFSRNIYLNTFGKTEIFLFSCTYFLSIFMILAYSFLLINNFTLIILLVLAFCLIDYSRFKKRKFDLNI